jgi:hypothetical protein
VTFLISDDTPSPLEIFKITVGNQFSKKNLQILHPFMHKKKNCLLPNLNTRIIQKKNSLNTFYFYYPIQVFNPRYTIFYYDLFYADIITEVGEWDLEVNYLLQRNSIYENLDGIEVKRFIDIIITFKLPHHILLNIFKFL